MDCKFSCPFGNSDISHVNIKDKFIQGLHNQILQTNILAKASRLKMINKVLKHSQAFETAIQDQSQLHSNFSEIHAAQQFLQPTNLAKAQVFHFTNHHSTKQERNQLKFCCGYGSSDHGIQGTVPWHIHCPVWGKLCNSCKKPNHFAAVCQQSQASALIPHIHINQGTDLFTSPESIQEIRVDVFPEVANSKRKVIHIFSDIGANICLEGHNLLQMMGLKAYQLRSCNKQVKAVGGSVLHCRGWIPVKFHIAGQHTTQPLYMCDKVDRLYLSKQGCMEMNILPKCYPRPRVPIPEANHLATEAPKQWPAPPTKSTQLPVPGTHEKIAKLEIYIRDKFAETAFNNSAPFASLTGPPAKIHLQPGTIPYAWHSPIPIPHQSKVLITTLSIVLLFRCP